MLSFLNIDKSDKLADVLNDIKLSNIKLSLDQFIEFEYFVTYKIKLFKTLDFFEEIKNIKSLKSKVKFDQQTFSNKMIFFELYNLATNKSLIQAEKLLEKIKKQNGDSITINKSNFVIAYYYQLSNNFFRAFIFYEEIIRNLNFKKRCSIENNLLLGCFINLIYLYSRSSNIARFQNVIKKAKSNKNFENNSVFYLVLLNEIEGKIKTGEFNNEQALKASIEIEKKEIIPRIENDFTFEKVIQFFKVQQLELAIALKNIDLSKSIFYYFLNNKIVNDEFLNAKFHLSEIEYYYLIGDTKMSLYLTNKNIESLKYTFSFDYKFAKKIFNRTIEYYKNTKDYEQLSKFLEVFHEISYDGIVQQNQIQMQLADAEFSLENKVREIEILNKLKDSEEKQVRTLKEKNKELERFAYVLAHDIKNPIRHIGNLVEIIFAKNKLSIEEKVGMIDIVKKSSNDVNELVNSILEYTSIEENFDYKENVDFNEVLELSLDKLDEQIKSSNAKFNLNTDIKSEVFMSGAALSKILINLIDNSIKFSKKNIKPIIQITSKSSKDYFQFTVIDNGIGIEKTIRADIFKSFIKNQKNTTFVGLGLGLATCQKILNLYNGEIEMKSIENEGSEFIVKIPAKKNKTISA